MEGYLTLFLAAFLAATIVPLWSEVLFAGLLAGGHDPLWLWAWASAGNTLGDEFLVNTETDSIQRFSTVAGERGGPVNTAWMFSFKIM